MPTTVPPAGGFATVLAVLLGVVMGIAYVVQTRIAEQRRIRHRRTVEAFMAAVPLVYSSLLSAFAPTNHFRHARSLATPGADIVAASVDVLYSVALLDLTAGPLYVAVPADLLRSGRYWRLQLLDFWNRPMGAVGSRSTLPPPDRPTSDNAQTVVVVRLLVLGPGHKMVTSDDGSMSASQMLQTSGTRAVLLGQIGTDGSDDDMASVHRLQDALQITPTTPEEVRNVPRRTQPGATPTERLLRMPATEFFHTALQLLPYNPAPTARHEAALVALTDVDAHGVWAARHALRHLSHRHCPGGTDALDGWKTYGSDDGLVASALSALWFYGAVDDGDVRYFVADGLATSGSYTLRLALPPTARWSLTAYDDRMSLLNGQARGSRDLPDHLHVDGDGAVRLWISAVPPDPKDAIARRNWLSLAGVEDTNVVLVLRLYDPPATPWQPGRIVKVS